MGMRPEAARGPSRYTRSMSRKPSPGSPLSIVSYIETGFVQSEESTLIERAKRSHRETSSNLQENERRPLRFDDKNELDYFENLRGTSQNILSPTKLAEEDETDDNLRNAKYSDLTGDLIAASEKDLGLSHLSSSLFPHSPCPCLRDLTAGAGPRTKTEENLEKRPFVFLPPRRNCDVRRDCKQRKSTRKTGVSRGFLNRRAKPLALKFIPKYLFHTSLRKEVPIPKYDKNGGKKLFQPPFPNLESRSIRSEYWAKYREYQRRLRDPPEPSWSAIKRFKSRAPRIPAKLRDSFSHRAPTPYKHTNGRKYSTKPVLKPHKVKKSRARPNREPLGRLSGLELHRIRDLKSKILRKTNAGLSKLRNDRLNGNRTLQSHASCQSNLAVGFHDRFPTASGTINNGNGFAEHTPPHRAIVEPILDQARGITEFNSPDPVKRLLSTINVQNVTPAQNEARKRRRREIVRDDGTSDDDPFGVGEPRKILRLYYKGVTELKGEFEGCEPLTKKLVRELMYIGRSNGYASVLVGNELEAETTNSEPIENQITDFGETEVDAFRNSPIATQPDRKPLCPFKGPVVPRLQALGAHGGVSMSRNVVDVRDGFQKNSKLSISELRKLMIRANEILGIIVYAGPNAVKLRKELQEIRNKAVALEPPYLFDDQQRAARIIREIVACNKSKYASGIRDPTDFTAWFEEDQYTFDTKREAIEMELNQLAQEISLLPESSGDSRVKTSKYMMLEAKLQAIDNLEDMYIDEKFDSETADLLADLFRDDEEEGELSNRDAPARFQGAEEAAIERAIAMSLADMGDADTMKLDSNDGSTLASDDSKLSSDYQQPPSDVALESKIQSLERERISLLSALQDRNHIPPGHVPPISNPWQDYTMYENKMLERAIAMSLAESRGEDPEDFESD